MRDTLCTPHISDIYHVSLVLQEYWNECVFGSILLTTGRHIATSNVSDYRNILRVTHVVNTHVVRVYTATIKVHNASFEWRVYEQFSDISAFAFGAADATENALSSWCRVWWTHTCTHAWYRTVTTYRAYFQSAYFRNIKYR